MAGGIVGAGINAAAGLAGGGGDAAGGAAGGGGDSFAANLAQLKQVSEEQQQKQMQLRMVSAKLGTDQNASKEKPQQ